MASVDKTEEQVTEQLQKLKIDTQCSQSDAGDSTEVSSKPDGNLSDCSVEASPLIVAADVTSTIVAHESGMDAGMYYVTNGYAAPHGFYYGGYDFPVGDWEDFSRHMGVDGLEVQSPGVYGDNGSVVYHPAGYAYAAHPLYGPYPPGAPISVMAADGQSYSGQPYPYAGHLYQPPVPPGGQFLPPASPGVEVPTSSAGDAINMGVDGGNGSVNGNNVAAGPRPGYPVTLAPPPGPYGRGILPMNGPSPGLQDVRIGNEGPRAGAPWSDATKMTEIPQRHATSQPLPVPALSGQALQSVTPILTHIPATQQHRPPPGVAAAHGTLNRAYQPSPRPYSGSFTTGRASQGLGANGFEPRGNGRGWIPVYKGKPRGRGNGAMYNGNGSLDILNEQNRGPRTIRIRNHRTAPEALRLIRGQGAPNGTPECPSSLTNNEQYNLSDFRTNYDNAKFFIIKSYSEDDIHKSIKYNVWASTPNGNKKLDAAYQDAQEKTGHCPIFLFFSVNASGQFCGVAEMVGPVDFNKSMDFWQQDKWSGKFSVKWHIVKDVPNSQFRHIILENNENKPVTNSRDTQEVRFEQGLEMLNLFNSYAFKTSILDDFQFYDNRQKVMQEKRARQQAYLQNQQGLAYGSSNENQPRHSLGEIQCKLQEEKLFKAEDHLKSGRLKDNIDSNSTSESQACNGVSPGEVSTEKPLLRPSEKGELTLAGSSEGENISNTH